MLLPYLSEKLNKARPTDVLCDSVEGVEFLDKVIAIDQSAIGRTPRSNPATYTGVFSLIEICLPPRLTQRNVGILRGGSVSMSKEAVASIATATEYCVFP